MLTMLAQRRKFSPRRLLLLVTLSILTLLTTACNAQDLRVLSTQGTVGDDRSRAGLTLCANGLEYVDSYGYGKGVSDLEVSLVGLQLHVSYREHTFAGPTTAVRERVQITLP
jgi:hypothetical protein